MKKKEKKLTHKDIRTLFEKNLNAICVMARNSPDGNRFKEVLLDRLTTGADCAAPVAVANIMRLIEYDGRTIREMSNGKDYKIMTIRMLWAFLAEKRPDADFHIDFLIDVYYQLLRAFFSPPPKPTETLLKHWMRRWPSGLNDDVRMIRIENRERIIKALIHRIERIHSERSRYIFKDGMSYEEKYDQVCEWWYDFRFHLAMAAKSPAELNFLLGNTLPQETMDLYHEARRKGIPVFVTPYYLSLLNISGHGYDDSAIRSYVIYSRQLVNTFGQIHAWEKEDIVKPGVPNAAGWLVPGENIHRRYPDVAILIPDSIGRACGGLCASCQRMYGFQSKQLNFNFEELKPKEAWDSKLRRLMKYFEDDAQLCDILITGGDALMSQNKTLRKILHAVYRMAENKRKANQKRPDGEKYAELKRVRLGTRLPVYLPMRINDELIAILRDFKLRAERMGIRQFFIQTHFQTPLEVTPEAREAIRRIQSTGWTITNQLVFNVAASRRGHTAKLRHVLNRLGILPYYTFTVKGFEENHDVFAPNSRSVQEMEEEKRFGTPNRTMAENLFERYNSSHYKNMIIRNFYEDNKLPFLATDRNVLNLPGIGKSMSFSLVGITPKGHRILAFEHDHTRKHSPTVLKLDKMYICENKSIYEYLLQLQKMGENPDEYESIWHYTESHTEHRFPFYDYQ